jgi:uncharacterized membrane protein YoaK (UPF0700 family)
MLRKARTERTLKENLMLASSTAFVAGIINVAGLIAFFAFSSNITGHVANLAKNLVDINFNDVSTLLIWLIAFFSGAYLASYLIRSNQDKSDYSSHSKPVILEICILFLVALYGDLFYKGTEVESEVIIGFILLSMGLQNGMASIVSGGLVKSAHLTGLITDLGAETAEYFQRGSQKPADLKNKIYVRSTILICYIFGGLMGAYFFYLYKFEVFYAVPLILLSILYYDLIPLIFHRFKNFIGIGSASK